MRPKVDHLMGAVNAHTTLTVLGGVQALLEGGVIAGGPEGGQETASQIIALCRQEMQRQLWIFDRHRAALKKARGEA